MIALRSSSAMFGWTFGRTADGYVRYEFILDQKMVTQLDYGLHSKQINLNSAEWMYNLIIIFHDYNHSKTTNYTDYIYSTTWLTWTEE